MGGANGATIGTVGLLPAARPTIPTSSSAACSAHPSSQTLAALCPQTMHRIPLSASTTPAPAPASCTSQDKDPYKTGSEVKCCDGLQKCLGDWSGNGNWHYNCKKSCGSSLLSHKRTLGKAQQHIQK